MSVVDRLSVIYELQDRRYREGLRRMNDASNRTNDQIIRQASRAERGVSRSFAGIGSAATVAAGKILALAAALGKLTLNTQSYKVIENRLRSLGEYSDEAAEKLASAAIRSRAPLEDMAGTVARIQKATGDGYDETIRRVETLNKLMAVGGATASEVNSVVVQLSQALSSGVLQGDELRSLREAAPVELLDAIAKAAGVTRAELKDMGADGKLTSDIIVQALDAMAATADEQFGRTTQTIGAAFTNLNTGLTMFAGRLDEGLGATGAFSDALASMGEWLANNADVAEELGRSVAAAMQTGMDLANQAEAAMLTLADTVYTELVQGSIFDMGEAFSDSGSTAADVIDAIINAVADMNGTIGGAAAAIEEAFLQIPDGVSAGMEAAINAVISAVESMVNGVLDGVRKVAAAVDSVTGAAAGLYGGSGTSIAGGINPITLPRSPKISTNLSSGSVGDAYNSGFEKGRGATSLYAFDVRAEADGYLRTVSFFPDRAGTYRLFALARAGATDPFVIRETADVVVAAAGRVTRAVQMRVRAGDIIAIAALNGGGMGYVSGTAADAIPWVEVNSTTLIGGAPTTAHRLQMRFELEKQSAGAAALQGQVDALKPEVQRIGFETFVPSDALARKTSMYAFTTPTQFDGVLREVGLDVTTVGRFRISAIVHPGNTTSPVTVRRTIEVVATKTGPQSFAVSMPVLKGELLALASDGASQYGYKSGVQPDLIPWFEVPNATMIPGSPIASQHRLNVRFQVWQSGGQAAPVVSIEREIRTVSLSASGLESAVEALTSDILGGQGKASRTFAHVAPAAGQRRYDLITLDDRTGVLELVQGTATAFEAEERQPALASYHLPVARAMVTETAVSLLPLAPLVQGLPALLLPGIDAQLAACKRGAPRFMAKVRSGAPVRIATLGDSIQHINSSGAGSTSAMNGANRDAGTQTGGYFAGAGYSAEWKAAVPLYTSVELGRPNDNAGRVHTRIGMVWELVAALERQGRVLGTSVWYDNGGIAGADTTDAWDDVANGPKTWLATVGGAGADLVIIALGMNERGGTGTEARLVKIAQYLQGRGCDVLFLEVPRPKQGVLADWRYTNAAIRRAAAHVGAGAVPLSAISEDGFIGALGVDPVDLAAANDNNHPGALELRSYGRLLARMVEP